MGWLWPGPLFEEQGWVGLSLKQDPSSSHLQAMVPPSSPKATRVKAAREPSATCIREGLSNGQGPVPPSPLPPPVGSPQASSTRACLCPLAPVGMQRASGKLQELPKHLVTLLILLINAYRCQQHGNGCLGTGVGARSGSFMAGSWRHRRNRQGSRVRREAGSQMARCRASGGIQEPLEFVKTFLEKGELGGTR